MSEKTKSWVRESFTFKLLMIGALSLLLLIPAGMIQNLISERQNTQNSAVFEITEKWGQEQMFSGPYLLIPYEQLIQREKETITANNKILKEVEFVSTTKYAYALPNTLDIDGDIASTTRYRGPYQAVLYEADLQFSGEFEKIDWKELGIEKESIKWSEVRLCIGISDSKGINDAILININEKSYTAKPGLSSGALTSNGVNTKIDIQENKGFDFNFKINTNGSESIFFIPLGKTTTTRLRSNWLNPKFNGSFLPDNRNITENGFSAEWKVLNLNRNFPQQWKDRTIHLASDKYGVDLITPVDHYQKSYRSSKYALMFIALTFMIFFFSEVLNKRKLHIIQYFLVGISLCVFYTLLTALSEHIGFTNAYLVGSISTVALISLYCKSIFKSSKIAWIVFGGLSALYGFLYTIIQLEDFALLMGSIGLFLVMSSIMYFSRNVDWHFNKDE